MLSNACCRGTLGTRICTMLHTSEPFTRGSPVTATTPEAKLSTRAQCSLGLALNILSGNTQPSGGISKWLLIHSLWTRSLASCRGQKQTLVNLLLRSSPHRVARARCPRSSMEAGQNVFKLKEHEKAAFFSSPGNRCHLASSLKPEEREFVVDSGAPMHMISKKGPE